MHLLWFAVSVIVCLFMYVRAKFIFQIAVWPFLRGKKLLFDSACSVLIVLPLRKVRPSFHLMSWIEGVR